MTEAHESEVVTRRDVAESIDWLAGHSDQVEFDSADWSRVDETGEVVVEGYRGDWYVRAVVRIDQVKCSYAPRESWKDPDDV